MSEETTQSLLLVSLEAAVPLWQAKLRDQPWERLKRRQEICSEVIATHGDDILFKSSKKGATAEAFNRLAEAIAILSFIPGGITLFGQHWEAKMST